MSKTEKTITKMMQNLQGWQIEDLQAVANHYGIEWRHGDGSHCIFLFGKRPLSVPAKRPIKPFYIKEFLARLEEMK